MQRPTAVPSVALPFAARRGYPTNVFNHANRVAAKAAVSEAEVAVEEEPVKLLTSDESEELLKIRHTTAHICAMATQKLFPDAQCTIGPWYDLPVMPVSRPGSLAPFYPFHTRRGRRPNRRAHG